MGCPAFRWRHVAGQQCQQCQHNWQQRRPTAHQLLDILRQPRVFACEHITLVFHLTTHSRFNNFILPKMSDYTFHFLSTYRYFCHRFQIVADKTQHLRRLYKLYYHKFNYTANASVHISRVASVTWPAPTSAASIAPIKTINTIKAHSVTYIMHPP